MSEFLRTTGIKARFYPPEYWTGLCPVVLNEQDRVFSAYYLSERGEAIEFHWISEI